MVCTVDYALAPARKFAELEGRSAKDNGLANRDSQLKDKSLNGVQMECISEVCKICYAKTASFFSTAFKNLCTLKPNFSAHAKGLASRESQFEDSSDGDFELTLNLQERFNFERRAIMSEVANVSHAEFEWLLREAYDSSDVWALASSREPPKDAVVHVYDDSSQGLSCWICGQRSKRLFMLDEGDSPHVVCSDRCYVSLRAQWTETRHELMSISLD